MTRFTPHYPISQPPELRFIIWNRLIIQFILETIVWRQQKEFKCCSAFLCCFHKEIPTFYWVINKLWYVISVIRQIFPTIWKIFYWVTFKKGWKTVKFWSKFNWNLRKVRSEVNHEIFYVKLSVQFNQPIS